MNKAEEAIKKIQGPCVILAGAGTGKTHTIVEKIKYLIENNIYEPEKIVCLTFSNEAANSLLLRVQKNNNKLKKPIIRTFHSFSADILREHGEKIGLNKEFKILDTNEAKIAMCKNLRISPYNCHKYTATISTAKDLGISIESLSNCLQKKLARYKDVEVEKRFEQLHLELQTFYLYKKKNKYEIEFELEELKNIISLKKFINAWQAYEKIKQIKNYQDYSDLNLNALKLIKQYPEIKNQYSYIIVDEFQDTNKIQLNLISEIADKNITIVGDLNQSIYRFRGAYENNFSEFKEKFNVKESDIFNLDKSYRSSNKILRLANMLIMQNEYSKENLFEIKNVEDREGEPVEIYELNDAKEETRKIIEIVQKEIEKGKNPNEICIMFRNHQYGRIIKQALERMHIPYYSVAKTSLLKQKSISSIIDYLTIINAKNKNLKSGEQNWWNIFHNLNIEDSDLIKIGKFIKENKSDIYEKIYSEINSLDLTEKSKAIINIHLENIKKLQEGDLTNLHELIDKIANIVIINEEETKEQKESLLNIEKFREIVKNFSSMYESDLQSFVNYLEIIKSLEIEIEAPAIEENGIRLMTLHATKGLEYETVILTNLANKRFPIERYNSNNLLPTEVLPQFQNREVDSFSIQEYERAHQLYEERRLCYVAFTRAKEKLILTYAKKYNERIHFPSQFLEEINYMKNQDIIFSIDDKNLYEEKINIEIQKPIQFIQQEKIHRLSPTALLTFAECQKKYEYKYVYHMPEEKPTNWEAIKLGSFVHSVLDKGVKQKCFSIKDFENIALELQLNDEWKDISLEEAMPLIQVFFERNKNKYNENSKTEQQLNIVIEGIEFLGFADRIDFKPEGMEIVDYKTGASYIAPRNRNWQLGLYAIAASKYGKVKRLTLDMLKHERPLEFELDENGNAHLMYSKRVEFNIIQVKNEIVETAKKIQDAMKTGFKPCPIEKNCNFCQDFVYNK